MRDIFKKVVPIILVALFLSLSAPVLQVSCKEDDPHGSVLSLSLKDTIGTAVSNNKDLQIQEQEVAFARAGIQAAQSKFFPALSMGYSYLYNDAVLPLNLLPSASAKKDPGIFLGYKNNNQASANGSQMIYDGGASIANLKEARVQLKIQEETLRARKLEIEFEAKRLFYGLLLAYETLRINQDLVDQAEAHYENVRKKFQQGTSSRFDALQSKVEVSKLIPPLVQAKNSIEIIANDLKKLLYLDMRTELKIRDSLSYSPIGADLESFLNEAYKNNPQMHLKILGIDLNKWGIEFAKSGWYPNINATANYTYTSDNLDNMFNRRHSNWSIGASGTFSVFDGMSTKAKVDEAKAKYQQAVLGKENIIEELAVNVRRGCLDLSEAHAVILAQKDSLAEAKDALNISYIGYDNGVMINLDVIDAQVSLSQVEKNLASGIYDYIMAKAYLDELMGREYLENKESNNGKKE
jgi:outer membrane protein